MWRGKARPVQRGGEPGEGGRARPVGVKGQALVVRREMRGSQARGLRPLRSSQPASQSLTNELTYNQPVRRHQPGVHSSHHGLEPPGSGCQPSVHTAPRQQSRRLCLLCAWKERLERLRSPPQHSGRLPRDHDKLPHSLSRGPRGDPQEHLGFRSDPTVTSLSSSWT